MCGRKEPRRLAPGLHGYRNRGLQTRVTRGGKASVYSLGRSHEIRSDLTTTKWSIYSDISTVGSMPVGRGWMPTWCFIVRDCVIHGRNCKLSVYHVPTSHSWGEQEQDMRESGGGRRQSTWVGREDHVWAPFSLCCTLHCSAREWAMGSKPLWCKFRRGSLHIVQNVIN